MGTTSDKLNYLLQTKNEIMKAIMTKGISVLPNDTFRSYAQKILDIQASGKNSLTERVGVRPSVKDKPIINTVLQAYKPIVNSNINIGSTVSVSNGIAIFKGTNKDDLITHEVTRYLEFLFKVKYINNTEYNPIVVFEDFSGNNGMWMYNGRIGSHTSATDGTIPFVDATGYCYLGFSLVDANHFELYYYNDGDYTNKTSIVRIERGEDITNKILTIGGQINNYYLKTNIDLNNSYISDKKDENKLYKKEYVIGG